MLKRPNHIGIPERSSSEHIHRLGSKLLARLARNDEPCPVPGTTTDLCMCARARMHVQRESARKREERESAGGKDRARARAREREREKGGLYGTTGYGFWRVGAC